MRLWLTLLVLLATPAAAQAEWREAVSKHFIVYSEGSDREIRQSAMDLEKYDYLLRLMMDLPDEPASKLKIYLMRDQAAVRKTLDGASGAAGYYIGSPRGPLAVGLRKDTGFTMWDISSQIVLFHEYAHHVMLQNSRDTYPAWYVEGFAEFYGATRILSGNVIEVGRPATHRMQTFRGNDEWIPLHKLLTATSYRDINNQVYLLYAQGWLLVHYLASNEERKGQLARYLLLINQGVDRKTAMDTAFGEGAAALDRELRNYSKKGTLEAVRLEFGSIDVGEISTRTLRDAEEALLLHDIALTRGVFARDAEKFVKDVRRDVARFPDDPYAAAILTQAEYLAGHKDLADIAADRWLTLDRDAPRAQMYKGLLAAEALARQGSTNAEEWKNALKWIGNALARAPDDPMIMEAYYDAHAARGGIPPARAQNALYKAMELVPRNYRLRHKVAADFERRNLIEAAIVAIRPAVYSAHAPTEESEKEKAKREKLEEKWRLSGEEKRERPDEMLKRLEEKFASAGGAARPAQESAAAD